MSKITNEPKNDEQIVVEVRNAIEHRATWMYLLLDEARKRGLDWDDFARAAITRMGCIHGKNFQSMVNDKSSLKEFSEVFGVGTGRKVFEMDVLEADEEKYYLDFHYCPLVSAWQKLGMEIVELPASSPIMSSPWETRSQRAIPPARSDLIRKSKKFWRNK